MTATDHGNVGQQLKPLQWAKTPPQDISVVTLPDASLAEAMVALGYGWDATDSVFVKLPVDHATGALKVVSTGTATVTISGQIPVGLGTDAIYSSTTALTPKYAFANVAASTTDGAVVAAVTAKKIRVLAAAFVAGATATNITFNSKPGSAGAAKSALFACGANGGAILPFNPVGWFETVSGEGLSVTTGAGATTGVQVVYVEV